MTAMIATARPERRGDQRFGNARGDNGETAGAGDRHAFERFDDADDCSEQAR